MSRSVSDRTRLDPSIRTLATHRVAELNRCAWCIDLGRHSGRWEDGTTDKLLAVAAHATVPRFSPVDRAPLACAGAIIEIDARVPDVLLAELRRHFSNREIVEPTFAVAATNFDYRLDAPLAVEAQGVYAAPALALANAAGRRRWGITSIPRPWSRPPATARR